MAIVKVLLVGLLMTALLFLKRFILKRNILIDWNATMKLMVPVVLVVALAGGTAFLLPKAEPKWPDPVPFLKGIGSGEGIGDGFGSGTTQKVGYGSNDERLGGSFVADDTLVFQVVSPREQYWRVETKDIYTSKGWISSSSEDDEQSFGTGETINHSINIGPADATETASVANLSNHTFLLQPYGVIRYDVAGYTTRMNRINEKIRATDMQYTQKVSNYSVDYSEPTYNYTELKASQVVSNASMANYLTLPKTLPDRVRTLAQEITSTSVSAYDKARAIERYFGRNGFVYDTQNVAIPEKDQDYVDQFLFDTKIGYCDNFSTAMVVMLRSVDIPARWVKGFVTGDRVESYQDGTALYDITNNEAHSWVEAYIDGIGWVPFEPTIGYANPADINFDTTEDEEQLLETPEEEPKEPEQPEELPEDKASATPGAVDKKVNLAWLGIAAIVLVVIAIIAALVLWFTRKKWLPKYYIRQYRKSAPNEDNYVTAYERLLKQLANYGIKRKKDQTLSSYAIEVDKAFSTDDMTKLTAVYEKLIYAKGIDPSEFYEMKESWEYLINRTSG
jgi:transglutaminase-like putative cysteine protease